MAEPNATAPTGASQANLPERPKDDAAAPEEGEKGPSKGALKKAAKEKEKVRFQSFNSVINGREI